MITIRCHGLHIWEIKRKSWIADNLKKYFPNLLRKIWSSHCLFYQIIGPNHLKSHSPNESIACAEDVNNKMKIVSASFESAMWFIYLLQMSQFSTIIEKKIYIKIIDWVQIIDDKYIFCAVVAVRIWCAVVSWSFEMRKRK